MLSVLLKQWSEVREKPGAVLCSIVAWKGSVPRKDYPLMLVLEDGNILGTIGGGSMELKVIHAAREMIGTSASRLLDFDMTGDDIAGDLGLCGGTLKVLIEPFTLYIENFMTHLASQKSSNKKLMVKLSIFQYPEIKVERQLISSRKMIGDPDPELDQRIKTIFENQQTKSFEYKGVHYLIWQPFSLPTLHIFGAGHVGQAVAKLAHFNELEVKVYDDRDALLTPERFPYAQRISIHFPILWEDIPTLNNADFVLIASREHKHDHELLLGLLDSDPGYIGLVSSARKWELLSKSLLSNGVNPDAVSKVHAPVGLDIEAQTVPEIAISILSEIISDYRREDH
ncbi:MAG: XdhC family protein [Candidatus Marinimicrobia bacterium]|nr:XdhC family protein [Candidatus Neomarinimicrobiota bacterium]